MKALFGGGSKPTLVQALSKMPTETVDSEAARRARLRRVVAMSQAGGRDSTIVSGSDKLGG